MNKTFAVAVLLICAFVFGFATNSTDAPTGTAGPRVVAKVALPNQSANIPTTTIFTPQQSGLYRASIYMEQTVPATDGNFWSFRLDWTDDAGAQELVPLLLNDSGQPAFAYEGGGGENDSWTFRAIAGNPVRFSVEGGSGTYEVYLTVERLM
jgi:hypothetical protein